MRGFFVGGMSDKLTRRACAPTSIVRFLGPAARSVGLFRSGAGARLPRASILPLACALRDWNERNDQWARRRARRGRNSSGGEGAARTRYERGEIWSPVDPVRPGFRELGPRAGRNGTNLTLVWHELGGPLVSSEHPSSYGTNLIRNLIPYELGGSVDLMFATEGVNCRIQIPVREA